MPGLLLIGGSAAIAGYYALAGVTQDVAYDTIRAGAALAIFLAARRREWRISIPWYLIALGQLSFALGDVTWDVYKHVFNTVPFPSIADVFYLAAYPALALGVLAQERRAFGRHDERAGIDAAIVATGVGLVVWALVMQPYAHEAGVSAIGRAISLTYPLMDVVLVAMGVRLAFARGGRTTSWSLWDVGLVSLLVADIAFLATQIAGTYEDGSLIDAAFLLSGVLWAASAWDAAKAPAPPAADVRPTRRALRGRVTILVGAALIGPVLIAIEQARGDHIDVAVTLGGSIALALLALARLTAVNVDRRVRNLAMGAVSAGALVTIGITTIPALRLTYTSTALRAALETAQALIAFLVTHLIYLRFRKTRLLSDLLLVYGLGLLGAANVFFVVLLVWGGEPDSLTLQTWAPLLMRGLAASAIVWAAWGGARRVIRTQVVIRMVGAQVLSIAFLAGAAFALRDFLPVGVTTGPAALTGSQPEVIGHPVLLAAQLVLMVLAWVGAGGFLYRSPDDPGPLTIALALGFIFTGFSRLSYAQYPTLYTDIVDTGDVLRLAGYFVFLVGAERQIHKYWEGLAKAAVSEERERTARELHDGLVQELSFIRSQTSSFAAGAVNPVMLDHVAKAADRALQESRDVVRVLAGSSSEYLAGALRTAAEGVATRAGAEVQLEVAPSWRVPMPITSALARIVREACANAVVHGGAKRIVVCVETWEGFTLRLTVRDDGHGFDPEELAGTEGFGLRSMRERAHALGGDFKVVSAPGQGTTVEVVMPTDDGRR